MKARADRAAAQRPGFRRLVSEVGLGKMGIVSETGATGESEPDWPWRKLNMRCFVNQVGAYEALHV